MCVCVCVCVCERERKRDCVCVYGGSSWIVTSRQQHKVTEDGAVKRGGVAEA